MFIREKNENNEEKAVYVSSGKIENTPEKSKTIQKTKNENTSQTRYKRLYSKNYLL